MQRLAMRGRLAAVVARPAPERHYRSDIHASPRHDPWTDSQTIVARPGERPASQNSSDRRAAGSCNAVRKRLIIGELRTGRSMAADKYERYAVTHVPEGLQISLWQALPALGPGVIALVILVACFLTDPYPHHSRIWAGLGVVTLALVALFGVRVETWVIADGVVRHKSSLWNRELLLEHPPGSPLIVRIEVVPCDTEGTQPLFPHVVHLFGQDGIEVGDGIRFRQAATLPRFLEALRDASPIDVTDLVRGTPGLEASDPRLN